MTNSEKLKSFTERILQECEQEGLTISEALQLPQELKFALNERVTAIHKELEFRNSQAD